MYRKKTINTNIFIHVFLDVLCMRDKKKIWQKFDFFPVGTATVWVYPSRFRGATAVQTLLYWPGKEEQTIRIHLLAQSGTN